MFPTRSRRLALFIPRFALSTFLLTALFVSPISESASADQEFIPPPFGDSRSNQYISAGGDHSCGVKQDGAIFCWGANGSGQTNIPVYFPTAVNNDFVHVSTGAGHSCGIRDDGSAWCWGENSSGQTVIPGTNSNFTHISAGWDHTCGRKTDGTVTCWGSNSSNKLNVPSMAFSQVSAGGSHTCALRPNNTIVCWGSNADGQRVVPSPNSDFTQVVAGQSHSCGRKTDGSVVCWGSNSDGQSTVPSPNTQFAHISAGYTHTCGLKGDGSVVCWGSNGDGESNVPAPNLDFAQVSAGGGHSCGVKTDGSVVCWGNNTNYESDPFIDDFHFLRAGKNNTCGLRYFDRVFCWGDNRLGQSNAPVLNNPVDISAGGEHACALDDDSSITCWGFNEWDQLNVPSPNSGFTSVSAGDIHTCGEKSDGSIDCWGDWFIWATDPSPNTNYMSVSAGAEHTCGVRTAPNQVVCWGLNGYGQLNIPTPNGSWTSLISSGDHHTCAKKNVSPGNIICWGKNDYGQLNAPAPIPGNEFMGLSAGTNHTCAMNFSGWLWCWGDNTYGQATEPPGTFLSIDAGGDHTCGIRNVSWSPPVTQPMCWGDDSYGQSTLALTKFKVPPVNQPPTANNDSYSTLEDTPLSVPSATGVLDNDNDPENDPLSAVEQSPPGSGTLNLAADGSFDYSPSGDYCGSDSFTYLARTALADSNIATVDINVTCVNDAPSYTASDPPVVSEDAGPQTVSGWATFTAGPSSESAQAVQQYLVSNISNPSLFSASPSVNASGDLSYTPAPNSNGTSTFDVRVQDDGGTANGGVDLSPSQAFTITVNATNDAPTSTGLGSLTVSEDTPGSSIDLWPYFDDLEDTDLQLTFTVSGYTNPGLFSLVTIGSDRNLLMAYQTDENGSSDVTVRATDTGGLWVESTLALTVTPVNDPPSFTAGGDVAVPLNSGAYNAPWASAISPGPSDESGQTVTFQVSNDNNALFVVQPAISPTGTLTFTPASGVTGSALVSVLLADDGGTTNGGIDTSPTETFTVTVAPFPVVTNVVVTTSGAPIPPGGTIIGRINRLTISFDMDVDNPPGDTTTDDVTNADNFMLLQTGPNGVFDTPHCAAGLSGDDVGLASGVVLYDGASFSAVVTINNGIFLPDGDYRLCVCGTTSVTAGGIALAGDGVTSGTDFLLDFSVVLPESLPDTGFAPNIRTALSEQQADQNYHSYAGLWLDIPSQQLRMPIVGVPLHQGAWDVTWLANQAGWLEGSAFPTWSGNSVITAHAINSAGFPGPFSALGQLRYGDEIIITSWGQQYIYRVRSVSQVFPSEILSVMHHEEYPWLTLLTCQGFDSMSKTYLYRTAVQAIQVEILEPNPGQNPTR